jgi:hypothetical protein
MVRAAGQGVNPRLGGLLLSWQSRLEVRRAARGSGACTPAPQQPRTDKEDGARAGRSGDGGR